MTNSSDEETIFINKDTDVLQIGNSGTDLLGMFLSGSELDVIEDYSDIPPEVNDQLLGAIQRRRRKAALFASDDSSVLQSGKPSSASRARMRRGATLGVMPNRKAGKRRIDRRNRSV